MRRMMVLSRRVSVRYDVDAFVALFLSFSLELQNMYSLFSI